MKYLIKKSLIISVVVFVLYFATMVFSFLEINSNTAMNYPIQAYIYSSKEYPDMFFSFVLTIPFAAQVLILRSTNILDLISVRAEKYKFVIKYFLYLIFSVFCICLIANLISAGICLNFARLASYQIDGSHPLYGEVFGVFQAEQPVLFLILWSIYKGIIGALLCFAALLVAYVVKNPVIALLAPSVFMFINAFIFGVLALPQFGIYSLYMLNSLPSFVFTLQQWGITLLLFISYIVFLWAGVVLYEKRQ